MLGRVRELIYAALPDVVETWKWRGVPVWEQDGIPCTGESYRDKIKLTFARGAPPWPTPRGCSTPASTATPAAIDLAEGDRLDARAFKAQVRAAARANRDKPSRRKPPAK